MAKKKFLPASERSVPKWMRLKRRDVVLVEQAIDKAGYKNFAQFAESCVLEKAHEIMKSRKSVKV